MKGHANRRIWLLAAAITCAVSESSSLADSGESCETFRLDRQAGNPFNHDLPNGTANPRYVTVRSQDSNCFAQAIAGIVNYDKSTRGKKPDVSPEYLSSQDCGWTVPGHDTNVSSAAANYNSSSECDLSAEMDAASSPIELGSVFAKSFDKISIYAGDRTRQVGCASEYLQSELRAMPATSTARIPENFVSSLGGIFRQLFSGAAGRQDEDAEITALQSRVGQAAGTDSRIQASAASRADEWAARQDPKPSHEVVAAKKLEFLSQLVSARVEQAKRCEMEHLVFGAYCKSHSDPDKRRLSLTYVAPESVKPDAGARERCLATLPTDDDAYRSKLARLCDDRAARTGSVNAAMRWLRANNAPITLHIDNMTGLMHSAMQNASTVEALGDDAGHALLLVGEERSGPNAKCGYWLRNSWGAKCAIDSKTKTPVATADYQCDPKTGHIWISQELLTSKGGAGGFYLTAFDAPPGK